MLHICYSNRLEVLLAPLLAQIDEVQREAPLAPIHIITPNRAVEQYITLHVANTLGIAGNLKFFRLGGFIRDILKADVPDYSPLDSTTMQLLLFGELSNEDRLQDPEFESLRSYFSGCAEGTEWTLRALQLSGELGRLFEEYSFSRPEMLTRWLDNQAPYPKDPIERWQRALYRRLCARTQPKTIHSGDQLGLFAPEVPTTKIFKHRLMFPSLFNVLSNARWPKEVFVFGLSYVAPSFVRLFNQLSKLTHLHLYTLNPCFEYWEDAHKKTLKQLKTEHYVFAEPPAAFNFDAEESPALSLWGRPGKEYLKTLNQLSKAAVTGGFIDPCQTHTTLLTQIQHDILMRKHPRAYTAPIDDSIRLIKSADRRSEVEATATYIQQLLQSDDTLSLRDVCVLICEDHKSEYLAHIEAVFWQKHGIPYNTVDRSLQSSSQVVTHCLQLLNLCTERFQMRTIESLMNNPLFWPPDCSTREFAIRWCTQLRPSYLLDNHTENEYFGIGEHDLHASIKNFIAQAFCGDLPPSPELENMRLEDPKIALTELPEALDFFQRLNGLIEQITQFQRAQHPLSHWLELLDTFLRANTFPTTSVDEYSFGQCRDILRSLGDAECEDLPLPFEALNALVQPRLDGLSGGMGQLLASGVIVSSLLPMRILPAQVMILMGLGSSGFPGVSHKNPLDLRMRDRMPSDVYPGERDRYLFLESLMSVRKHLVCTYVGYNPTTGEANAPSAIIEELLFILESYIGEDGVRALEREHTVLSWNRDPQKSLAQSQNEKVMRDVHEAVQGGAVPTERVKRLLNPLNHASIVIPSVVIDSTDARRTKPLKVNQIKAFLKSPLQASARVRLGLFEPDQAEPESDREPLKANNFDLGHLASNCFWANPTLDQAVSSFLHGLTQLQARGRLPFGVFFDRVQAQGIELLEMWWKNAELADLGCPTEYHTVRLGDGQLNQNTRHRFAPIELLVESALSEPTRFSLEGNLERVHADGKTIARVINSQRIGKKYFLDLFLSAVCLAANDQSTQNPTGLIVLPTKPFAPERLKTYLRLPSPEQARTYLTTLATELTTRFHDYRLPIEAVLKYVNTIEQSSSAEFKPLKVTDTADQYGPLRTPGEFSAPLPDEVESYIRERFGPWFGSEVRP